jgi:hypothetical protein
MMVVSTADTRVQLHARSGTRDMTFGSVRSWRGAGSVTWWRRMAACTASSRCSCVAFSCRPVAILSLSSPRNADRPAACAAAAAPAASAAAAAWRLPSSAKRLRWIDSISLLGLLLFLRMTSSKNLQESMDCVCCTVRETTQFDVLSFYLDRVCSSCSWLAVEQ